MLKWFILRDMEGGYVPVGLDSSKNATWKEKK